MDTESFPFQSKDYPKLWDGAYSEEVRQKALLMPRNSNYSSQSPSDRLGLSKPHST